jgi:thiol-disulfide isomerase/thioredoxin
MLIRALLTLLLVSVLQSPVSADQIFDYQLRDMDGKLHRVSDHRGKWLVINFWATWCPPCIAEMPELERFYSENKTSAHLWGVTFEDTRKDKIIEFATRLGITYPILGYGQDPLTGYGQVSVLPTTFVIDPDGLFFHRFEGPITAQNITDLIAQAR